VGRHQRFVLLFSFFILVGSLGCAGRAPASPAIPAPRAAIRSTVPQAGEPVFATIEAAVRDAFEVAEDQAGPGDRERLRIGTIRRVEGGFAWTEPVRSRGTVGASTPLQARLRLGPDDVAVYSLHPRSGDRDLDRLNEAVGAGERRLVDVQDPLHRPLFVRTPSRRILRYPAAPESLEVVRAD
jgi:hypothetical protein